MRALAVAEAGAQVTEDDDRALSSIHRVADLVRTEDIDLGDRTSPEGAITFLFSDIEGSTSMLERLGDERWFEVLRAHNEIVRRNVARFGGTEVKAQGDGFMLAFLSSLSGVHCAMAIQRELAAWSEDHADEPVRVRIGLHSGFVIADAQDFFGRNVVLAARVADRARGSEILVSSELREYTRGDRRIVFGSPQQVSLKGLTGTFTVYPVSWHDDEQD